MIGQKEMQVNSHCVGAAEEDTKIFKVPRKRQAQLQARLHFKGTYDLGVKDKFSLHWSPGARKEGWAAGGDPLPQSSKH